MTVAQVKVYLGIPSATTTYDADIARLLPIVESTVNRITNGIYILQVNGTITNNSKELIVNSIYSQTRVLYGKSFTSINSDFYNGDRKNVSGEGFPYNDPGLGKLRLHEILSPGQLITGTGIAADAFIESIQAFGGESKVILSAVSTATAEVSAYTSYPISFQSTIAKGVWWMIREQRTSITDNTWTSRSVGPVSETRSAAEMKIDGQYGMPAWFVKAFPRVYR